MCNTFYSRITLSPMRNHQRFSDRKNLNFCQHPFHTGVEKDVGKNSNFFYPTWTTWTRNGYCSNLKGLRLHIARWSQVTLRMSQVTLRTAIEDFEIERYKTADSRVVTSLSGEFTDAG